MTTPPADCPNRQSRLVERVNKEITRRTDVVGVFPHPEALLRLAEPVLVEQHDEWAAADRRHGLA